MVSEVGESGSWQSTGKEEMGRKEGRRVLAAYQQHWKNSYYHRIVMEDVIF